MVSLDSPRDVLLGASLRGIPPWTFLLDTKTSDRGVDLGRGTRDWDQGQALGQEPGTRTRDGGPGAGTWGQGSGTGTRHRDRDQGQGPGLGTNAHLII